MRWLPAFILKFPDLYYLTKSLCSSIFRQAETEVIESLVRVIGSRLLFRSHWWRQTLESIQVLEIQKKFMEQENLWSQQQVSWFVNLKKPWWMRGYSGLACSFWKGKWLFSRLPGTASIHSQHTSLQSMNLEASVETTISKSSLTSSKVVSWWVLDPAHYDGEAGWESPTVFNIQW